MLRPHETGIDRTIEPHDFGIMADRRKLIGVLPDIVEARRCCARHQHGTLAADEAAWRELWSGYNAFYQTSVPEAVTARTWQRILDTAASVFGRIAVIDDCVAGFSICVLHEGT
ncbi:MAG: hypothetical protein WBE14_06025, partial [Xanthobacteraceae bacterium]